MKSIILFSMVLLGFFSKAQQIELMQNDWYLQKIIIDDNEYLTPINEEVSAVPIYFYNEHFAVVVCNSFGGQVQYYSSGPSFVILGVDWTLMDCNLSENTTFESLYFGQFFFHDTELAGPFVYTIEEMDNYKLLTITNSAGVQAIYHNQNTVSIPQFSQLNSQFIIYPNPATSKLFIQDLINKGSLTINMTNLLGQEVLSERLINHQTELDISQLKNGVYLIRIYDENKLINHSEKIIIE